MNFKLKQELIDYINTIPDEKLITLKLLLRMLSKETIILGQVSESDLSLGELVTVKESHKQYECGEYVDFEDYLSSRRVTV